MMNFNVKYHFSHALMHWLREEGALGEELERDSIIVACKKKKPILHLFHISAYTVSELCPLYTVTHLWMCTHPTDTQPCKHIPKWSLAVHTLLGTYYASPRGGGLTLIDLPPTYSLASTAWLVTVYSNAACTRPTPLQTDLSFSLFLLSSLLPFPLQSFCWLFCAKFWIDYLWSCLHEWKTEKKCDAFRGFIIFFSNLFSVGLTRQHELPLLYLSWSAHMHAQSSLDSSFSPYVYV